MNNILESIKGTWGKLSRPMQIGVGIFVLGIFISLLLLAMFSRTDYQILFSGLGPEDAGAVVQALQEQGTPYRLGENGTSILVPQDQVFETRIALATSGMPTGGVVGFEIFNSTRLGETEADRQLRFQWALQGELTRTIRQINEVTDARIHIVMPKRSLFVQDSQAATASVLLQLKPGAQLNKNQIRAIANLVSSSVEGLAPENVTIVDTRGTVLNAPGLAEFGGHNVTDRFEMQWLYEQQMETSIVAMLERIFGFGNVVARVNANLDFSQMEEYSEVYTPVNRGEGLVRSTQSYDEVYRGTSTGAGGVPGVDANVPGYVFGDAGTGTTEWQRTEGTTNYELNRTETRSLSQPGQVNNLNVSVWINGNLTPAQIASVEESVSRATGLKATRGDSIYVTSVPFETSAFLTDATIQEVAQGVSLYWFVAIALLLFIIIIGFIIGRRRAKEQEVPLAAGLDIIVGDDEDELPTRELTPEEMEMAGIRKNIQKLAKEKPDELAMLMKTWLADD